MIIFDILWVNNSMQRTHTQTKIVDTGKYSILKRWTAALNAWLNSMLCRVYVTHSVWMWKAFAGTDITQFITSTNNFDDQNTGVSYTNIVDTQWQKIRRESESARARKSENFECKNSETNTHHAPHTDIFYIPSHVHDNRINCMRNGSKTSYLQISGVETYKQPN